MGEDSIEIDTEYTGDPSLKGVWYELRYLKKRIERNDAKIEKLQKGTKELQEQLNAIGMEGSWW